MQMQYHLVSHQQLRRISPILWFVTARYWDISDPLHLNRKTSLCHGWVCFISRRYRFTSVYHIDNVSSCYRKQTWVRLIFFIRFNSVSESFDSIQLMTHNGFTRINSNQLTTQNGLPKFDGLIQIDSRLKMLPEFWFKCTHDRTAFQNFDSDQLMTQKTQECWFGPTHDSMILFIFSLLLTPCNLFWTFNPTVDLFGGFPLVWPFCVKASHDPFVLNCWLRMTVFRLSIQVPSREIDLNQLMVQAVSLRLELIQLMIQAAFQELTKNKLMTQVDSSDIDSDRLMTQHASPFFSI